MWSYQLGLQNGWMPTDPRQAHGMCAQLGVPGTPFNGSFQPWQTGGAGAGTIAASATSSYGQFPPTSLAGVPAGQVTLLPSYTSTRSQLVTLPPPTFSATASFDKGVSVGDGWFDAQDTNPMVTPVAGCVYPDAWSAAASPVPSTSACGATSSLGAVAPPAATPSDAPTDTPVVPPPATGVPTDPTDPTTAAATDATDTPGQIPTPTPVVPTPVAVPPARR